jgi:hypothetical protein
VKKAKSEIENFKRLTASTFPLKLKFRFLCILFVCELNKIFRDLCICLCVVCVFFVCCFEVQIVKMAYGSAASSSVSVGVRRSQKVKNCWPMP